MTESWRRIGVLFAAVLTFPLAGCVIVLPAADSPGGVDDGSISESPEPVETFEPHPDFVVDEDDFFDSIARGYVIYDLPRMPGNEGLKAQVLQTGYDLCGVLKYPGGYEQALELAQDTFTDRTLFTRDMPLVFVQSARYDLCGYY